MDAARGPHYLSGQLHTLDYSGAKGVGKQARHMYLGAQDVTIVRFPTREHRYTDLVIGATTGPRPPSDCGVTTSRHTERRASTSTG